METPPRFGSANQRPTDQRSLV